MQRDMTTLDLAIIAALTRLAEDQERTAQLSGDAQPFGRCATAYRNAATYYAAGVECFLRCDGRYQIRRPGGGKHIVTMRPGAMPACSCPAGRSFHWPIALCIGIERSQDYLDDELVGELDGATVAA